MHKLIRKLIGTLYHRGIQMLFMGCVTGFLAGVAVTFYTILASIGEGFSTGIYAYIRERLFLIPLLLAALAAGALVIGVAVKFVPMARGSGIPQIEGAARGELKYNWFTTLCTTFAASLACIFLGLSAGSEGPSIQIGGCCGYGSSRLFSRTEMLRRYQITGGACAGLAVALNAPLTGMAFAFEETHKKFSPEVFICAFSSVVTGVVTRNLIRAGLGYSVDTAFGEYVFHELPYGQYGFLAAAALVCAVLAVVFYYVVLGLKKLFSEKVTFLKGAGKMLFPFLLAGAFGLITVYAMGGGHALIEAIGTRGGERGIEVGSVFSSPLTITLLIILVLKFISSLLNIACGVPCGVFIPMLAIGATIGALSSTLFTEAFGMNPAYGDLIVMICMATFFTCIVRAPVTGIVMVVELTGSFTSLLPVTLGVAIGYMVGEIAGTEPIYEVLLKQVIKESGITSELRIVGETLVVEEDSIVEGKELKELLLPAGTGVQRILRGEKELVLSADTVVRAGDVLTFESRTADPDATLRELRLLTGQR